MREKFTHVTKDGNVRTIGLSKDALRRAQGGQRANFDLRFNRLTAIRFGFLSAAALAILATALYFDHEQREALRSEQTK